MVEERVEASRPRCLVDAIVLIDGARHGFLEALVTGHEIAVAETVLAEVVYYKTGWHGAR